MMDRASAKQRFPDGSQNLIIIVMSHIKREIAINPFQRTGTIQARAPHARMLRFTVSSAKCSMVWRARLPASWASACLPVSHIFATCCSQRYAVSTLIALCRDVVLDVRVRALLCDMTYST